MEGGKIKKYDEDTLERIQSGDFVEDFNEEEYSPFGDHGVFLDMLESLKDDGWLVYDAIVQIEGGVSVNVEF